jgi:hypothetical protein
MRWLSYLQQTLASTASAAAGGFVVAGGHSNDSARPSRTSTASSRLRCQIDETLINDNGQVVAPSAIGEAQPCHDVANATPPP